ncbi:hypothetical protein [Ahrensia sp. R2A130]|nr:hypothetical protein [Ahrensia sp. R2A130]EFL90216.1 hypothetical protein R2A130_0286 [Ahrensia sp. R2A130]
MSNLEHDTRIDISRKPKPKTNWTKAIFEGAGAVAVWIIVLVVIANVIG